MSSRGFRLSHLQMEHIYDVASELHANPNQVVKALVHLGLEIWGRLTESQRRRVLAATGLRYGDVRVLRRYSRIQQKIESLRSDEELGARLGFTLPTRTKESIRRLAKRTGTTMSEVAREKLRT